MKRFGLVLCIVFFLGFTSIATKVSINNATLVAKQFFSEQFSPDWQSGVAEIVVMESFIIKDQGRPLYYIFNLKPDGWIAVAADDAIFPILAYSFEGVYDETHQAPQFTAWMKQYEDQIKYAIRDNIAPFPKTVAMWNQLTDAGYQMPASRAEVSPLITTHWDQSPWYNEMCPADPPGSSTHCPAGCVPVCMAQVMYYFRWPETGTGSYTYIEPSYGVLTADFGATTYK